MTQHPADNKGIIVGETNIDRQSHWQSVYERKAPDEVSWFQSMPALSQALIARVAPAVDAPIIDVGGGASMLVDTLMASGYTALTVLDFAPAAIAHARTRLGDASDGVTWRVGNVLTELLDGNSVAVWHDRAVFHFLTSAEDRARYVAQVRRALRPGGHVIIATFAEDGPTRCSGLEIVRYTAPALLAEFGDGFALMDSQRELHQTPSGSSQQFIYCVLHYRPAGHDSTP